MRVTNSLSDDLEYYKTLQGPCGIIVQGFLEVAIALFGNHNWIFELVRFDLIENFMHGVTVLSVIPGS
jgi:hypothetical protein